VTGIPMTPYMSLTPRRANECATRLYPFLMAGPLLPLLCSRPLERSLLGLLSLLPSAPAWQERSRLHAAQALLWRPPNETQTAGVNRRQNGKGQHSIHSNQRNPLQGDIWHQTRNV
jgi:hypothetical protein